MIYLQSEPRSEDDSYDRNDLFVFVFVAMVLLLGLSLSTTCDDKEKQYDMKLWKPWAALGSNQINMIRLFPLKKGVYFTISRTIEIEDKTLIREIKENMNRKPMKDEDRPGYHWHSQKRVILTAYTVSGDFSFVLFFHDRYPSVRYQRLRPGSSEFDPVGEGWRSAELCRILTEYIRSIPDVGWVKSKD